MAARRKKRKPTEVQAPPPSAAKAPRRPPQHPVQAQEGDAQVPTKAIAKPTEPVIPRNAEDVIANVITRQLVDEIEEPPEEPLDPEIFSLRETMRAVDDGRPVGELLPLIARATSGQDQLDTLVYTHYRRSRAKKLARWLENDARIDRVLERIFKRGDFTPAEALVFKQLAQNQVKALATELLNEIRHGVPTVEPEEAATRIDYSLQITEKVKESKQFSKMTPQGREIIRRLLFQARAVMYPEKKKK